MTQEQHHTDPDIDQTGQLDEQDRRSAEQLSERSRWPIGETPVDAGPVDRGAIDRAEERIDASAGGGLNEAAVQAAGLPRTASSGDEELPGTQDLGAAGGRDVGAGLGRTRGQARQNPRGQITGSGGTRGSGAGTGHLEDTAGQGQTGT